MNIAPFSQSPSLFPTARTGPAQPNSSVGSSFDQNSSSPQDIIAQIAQGGAAGLIKFQEKQVADKARKDVLDSLGLTEADLKRLTPEKLSAVDDAVTKAVKDALKNSLQGDGKPKTASAGGDNNNPAAAPSTKSLISSETLNALFGSQ